MTQSTSEWIEAQTDRYEMEESRNYRRTPRPFRQHRGTKRRRPKAALSINGRNTTRSTNSSMHLSRLAVTLQEGTA